MRALVMNRSMDVVTMRTFDANIFKGTSLSDPHVNL